MSNIFWDGEWLNRNSMGMRARSRNQDVIFVSPVDYPQGSARRMVSRRV
jgi:hypothetical protein